jgi:SpoVK/Ycf46/Vps4 family AAA+-type ATPase
MARSDLLVTLVKASATGDRRVIRSTVEAIIAEEKARQHNGLAERLTHALNAPQSHANSPGPVVLAGPVPKGRDYLSEIVPRRTLADLVLGEETRAAIADLVEEQTRADILRAHGVEPRHRIMLVGPPGNGKTSLAEALAEALGVGLFVVRYELLIGSYLGETASRLRRILDYARTTPCVLFFDEFDAIGKERGDTHETGEIKRVVSSLLMQIDDLPSYTVLVAATNHPELLDRAAWRRFQLRLDLPPPTTADVARYVEAFFAKFDEPLGISPKTIASKLARISYSDLEQFCLDVRRRQILAQGSTPLKSIAQSQLKQWQQRLKRAEAAGKQ